MNNYHLDRKNIVYILLIVLVVVGGVIWLMTSRPSVPTPSSYSAQGKFVKMESLRTGEGVPQFKIYFTSDYGGQEKIGILDPRTRFFALVKDDKGNYTRTTLDLGKLKKGDAIYVSSESNIDANSTFNIKEIYVQK